MKHIAFSTLLFFAAVVAYAAIPPTIPPEKLPPAVYADMPVPHHEAPRAVRGSQPRPASVEEIRRMPVSSALYFAMLEELRHGSSALAIESAESLLIGTVRESSTRSTSTSANHRPVVVQAYGQTPVNATSDSNQDVEPSVAAVNIGGTMHTTTVATKYVQDADGLNRPHLQAMHTTSFGSFSGPVELPLPSGYLSAGDPIMAVNPYTVGIAPRRMYCSGLAFNDHPYDTPSSIVVWHSDDGGQSWSPGAVVIATAGGGYALDKPAMTVSWYSGTLGYMYITYIMLDRNTNFNSSSIWVARSTDGGNTFPVKTVISYDNVQFPQVVVDSNGGTIYAIWANRTYGDLRMSQSADAGVSFGAHDIVAGGNLINGSQLNGSIRANSIPMARFNWAAGRVCIVYYAWGAAGPNTDTDVYYTFKPGCTNCNAYGWQDPIRVNDVATRDQFMPGIDFNSSGNVIVTFYDRRNDSANLLYDEYAAYLTSTGVPVGNQPNLLLSAFASNPISAGVTPWPGFIGDYQDVWDDAYPEGESATAAWIGIPFASDDYLSRIFY